MQFAVDSHAHVFEPKRFPPGQTNSHMLGPAELGTARQFHTVLKVHGISHALLVNPLAGYGMDNGCMLDAIANSKGRYKGVALISHEISDKELQRLSDGGVVGARFSTVFPQFTSIVGDTGRHLLERIKGLGWFAQIYVMQDGLLDFLPSLKASGIKVVVDHCGCPAVSDGLAQPGFKALLDLGKSGAAAIKLSGVFRSSKEEWPYSDCDPYVHALIESFTLENCLWGSDWPFVRVPVRMDYGPMLALVERWIPDGASRQKVMWDAPKKWFGFRED